ncbi:hypothetical protein BV25DRAFT_1169254 [Artomyces pyxidatus]|uniref:Uncharacterized protein n=1 Tax=Artomyces pyxidatus TaxID=48021 RepID=A0ACB8SRW3_9AGAM|nr:hypothetical protein BV25DRAFT_1169254 [Artomyces pyxidatus]
MILFLLSAFLAISSPRLLAEARGKAPASPSTPTSYYQTTSATPTSANLPSSPAAPIIQFDPPSNTSTCDETTLSWASRSNNSVPLTIQVTDAFTTPAFFKPGLTKMMVTFRTLTTSVPSTASKLDWSPVDVPEGHYSALAFDAQGLVYAHSAPFFVAAADGFCVATITSTFSSSTTSASPTSPSTLPQGLTTPSTAADVHSDRLSPKALAGAIVGSICGVILLVAAFSIPRLLRRHLPSHRDANRPEGRPYYLF